MIYLFYTEWDILVRPRILISPSILNPNNYTWVYIYCKVSLRDSSYFDISFHFE